MDKDVLQLVRSRRSIRAFQPRPVPRDILREILDCAARAPSGSNIQPWQVIVLSGNPLERFRDALSAHAAEVPAAPEYHYYPQKWREPYLARRRTVGWQLYGSLGIERGQHDRMTAQRLRNFRFFDAPVGLIFTMDRDLEIGSWIDLGLFLQNILIAARAFGLDSCLQAAFADHPQKISELLYIPPGRQVICGMALGYADALAPENGFVTERAPLDHFVRFLED